MVAVQKQLPAIRCRCQAHSQWLNFVDRSRIIDCKPRMLLMEWLDRFRTDPGCKVHRHSDSKGSVDNISHEEGKDEHLSQFSRPQGVS